MPYGMGLIMCDSRGFWHTIYPKLHQGEKLNTAYTQKWITTSID